MPDKDKTKTFHVFVYGTLKNMHEKNRWTHGGDGQFPRLVGEARTIPDFVLFDGGYPLAVLKDATEVLKMQKAFGKIKGQVFEVTEDQMVGLDSYEGYPDLYTRTEIPVEVSGLEDSVTAWIYVGNQAKQQIDHRAVMIPGPEGTVEWMATSGGRAW